MNMAEDGLPLPLRYWAILNLAVGMALSVLDSAIANIALPAIAKEIHASAADSIWVINAYQLTVVISLLPFASLGDIFGYRRVYRFGIALYTGSVHTARDCAKTACLGMMRSLSLLGTPHGVTSNMVHPGFVDTHHDDVKFQGSDERRKERMKKHRMGHGSVAEDPAGMVLFLASENGRFISGQELFVTGGMPPHLGI